MILNYFGVMLVCMTFSFSSLAADSYGVFMVIKGDVKVTNLQNQTNVVKVGSKILPGESVISGADSRAKIVMSDRNVINISPDTKMKITQYSNNAETGEKNVELNLLEGKVRNNVEQTYDGEKSKFLIKTPTAVAGVRGTQFMTSFDPKLMMTQIVTLKGAVTFNAISPKGEPVGKPVVVKKGEMTQAAQGAAAEAPKAVPKEDMKKIDADTTASNTKKEDPKSAANEPAREDGKKDNAKEQQASNDNKGPADKQPSDRPQDQKRDVASDKPAPPVGPAPVQMIDKSDMDVGMARDIKNPVAPPPPPPPPAAAPVIQQPNQVVRDIIKDTVTNGKTTVIVRPVPR